MSLNSFSPLLFVGFFFFSFVESVFGSTGDRSQMFHSCLQKCLSANCSSDTSYIPLYLRILQWTCPDECKYMCMWPTTDWFVNAGIGVQQFYGKWPFVRIFGLQEPAAALFSIMNLSCHIVMIRKFRSKVSPKAPFYLITHIYCLVCCNAWIWSIFFHMRDIRFTEIMDYLSAISMVLFSVYHLIIRMRGMNPGDTFSICVAILSGLFLMYHSYTAFFLKMDYGYNMFCNIALGCVNVVGWLIWCWKNYKQRPYAKLCAKFMFFLAVTTLFEVGDFPPIAWTFDAHALWHLSTSPLAILWYRFLIEDCLYMSEEKLNFDKIA